MTRPAIPSAPPTYEREQVNQLGVAIVSLSDSVLHRGERFFTNGETGTEIILIDANGGQWKLGVDTSGNLTTTSI